MKYIGIDVGGTTIKAGLVDDKGNILVKDSVVTRAKEDQEVLFADIANLAKSIAAKGGCRLTDIESIGIGCPGSVDSDAGLVLYANNVNLFNSPMGKRVSELTGLPVYLGNDADCAALGEFYALNDDSIKNLVAVTLGTGVGGGIIINRQIFSGSNGTGGEIGHIVIESGGEPCTCGRRGCWESYASATALARDTLRAAEANPDSILAKLIEDNNGRSNGRIPFTAARMGDKAGKEVVDNYIRYVGEGVVDVINIFQPDVVVIGGGVSKAGKELIEPLREYVGNLTYGHETDVKKTELRLATLGNDAGIIGAAFLGIK